MRDAFGIPARVNILEFTALVGLASGLAGFLGALTGLGGGVVIVPLLVIAFGVDIHYAIGASLVSVIATSSGAAAAYLREGYTNTRAAMLLEVASTAGALSGAALAARVPASGLAIAFGGVLLYSARFGGHHDVPFDASAPPDRWAAALRLDSSYPTPDGPRAYRVQRVPMGFGLMYGAGILSGLLGIGSGAVKVLALDRAMRMPFKVSTTTSNFIIGVTAAASAGVYLRRGYLEPGLAMPVVLGVLVGSLQGARVLATAQTSRLRLVFTGVIVALGLEMIFNGFGGRL
ncbi:MAG TPA: sulfite exporter TauE/SafE family protein [Vicinamibacterales bacterium]|nr:sulfite exporter TauE/SafE family protein [Vicinamibacterales bacterium]